MAGGRRHVVVAKLGLFQSCVRMAVVINYLFYRRFIIFSGNVSPYFNQTHQPHSGNENRASLPVLIFQFTVVRYNGGDDKRWSGVKDKPFDNIALFVAFLSVYEYSVTVVGCAICESLVDLLSCISTVNNKQKEIASYETISFQL